MRRDQVVPSMVMRDLQNAGESSDTDKKGNTDGNPSRVPHPPSVTRDRAASLHNRSQADRDIINYITDSQTAMNQDGHPPMVRSNSYTIQDVQRQRESIQASLDASLEDDPTFRYFHSKPSNLKGRRYSKSLPELQHLKNFPLMATQYTMDTSGVEGSDGLEVDDDEEDDEAEFTVKTAWAAKSEFIFTGVSLALGLNNVWRFPYFCYKFNGGSFLVAYLFCLVFFGLPILSMEYALGQLTRRGPIAAFGSLVPLLKGVSVAASFIALVLAPMYSTVNSWSLFYFFKSFYSNPLWSKCGNSWNSIYCVNSSTTVPLTFGAGSKDLTDTASDHIDPDYSEEESEESRPNFNVTLSETTNSTSENATAVMRLVSKQMSLSMTSSNTSVFGYHVVNNTTILNDDPHAVETVVKLRYPTQEFFDDKLLELEISESFWGNIQWELIIFVFVTWFIVFVTLRKNILFSSHPSSCISVIPFAIFGVFFARALMFEGSREGIIYFFQPDWNHIRNPELWLYAAGLSIHSLGCVFGISFAKATCNRERNNFLRFVTFISYQSVLSL